MEIGILPIGRRSANIPDYFGAALLSSKTVMVLDDFRTGNLNQEEALALLRELRKYTQKDHSHPCFSAYIQFKKEEENYQRIQKQISHSLQEAEREIRSKTPGKAIDDVIAFADDFGDVCLAQTERP